MNCADVIPFLVETGIAVPQEVAAHIEGCGTCRAQQTESRRVSALVAGLPGMRRPDVAGKVMARIGFGNGRPTRDKILDQLAAVREELEDVVCEVSPDELDRRPSAVEPSIAEVVAHLPSAEDAMARRAAETIAGSGGDAAGLKPFLAAASASTVNATADAGDLRRVRERTLRLVSGLRDAEIGVPGAEALRAIYRHEADHVAEIRDAVDRVRRARASHGS